MFKPFKTHLTIFQQEGYSPCRFFGWWFRHPLTFSVSAKKPLVMTPKARLLTLLSFTSFIALFFVSLFFKVYFLIAIIILSFFFLPFIYLFLAALLLTPYEKINRQTVKNKTRTLLQSFPNLTTIGITGSFGKTTVKDFLYEILGAYRQTVKTPESYNTVFGIAKVVKLEILSKTKFFICEMGAFVRGEVAEIALMVRPDYAILTAIGSQHLERFKTLKNTTLAKFELIDAVSPQNALVNLDNPFIKEHLSLPRYQGVKTFSLLDPQADFFVEKYSLTPKGVSFRLIYKNYFLDISSPIFGTGNLYNLVTAVSMSLLLGVPTEIIKKVAISLKASPHRLELKKINKATLIDNAFSSNEDGFTAIIADLKNLPGKKALLTPGIIELGSKTAEVHQKLGKLSSPVFDQIILVGRSDRTLNFEKGFSSCHSRPARRFGGPDRESIKIKPKISYIDNSADLWPIIEDLSKKYDWILLDNDLPDTF